MAPILRSSSRRFVPSFRNSAVAALISFWIPRICSGFEDPNNGALETLLFAMQTYVYGINVNCNDNQGRR